MAAFGTNGPKTRAFEDTNVSFPWRRGRRVMRRFAESQRARAKEPCRYLPGKVQSPLGYVSSAYREFSLVYDNPQGGNRGYGIAVFVPFHKNGEFSLILYCSIPSRFYHLESLAPQEKMSRVAGLPRQPYLKNSLMSGAVAADPGKSVTPSTSL
jgi:hypothetical protein